MEKFPDDFNRKTCNDILTKNQTELIKQVRKIFYDTITKAIDDCDQYVILTFPDKLWQEQRAELIKELLDRFGKIKLEMVNPQHSITKLINDANDIPKDVKKVTIKFIE